MCFGVIIIFGIKINGFGVVFILLGEFFVLFGLGGIGDFGGLIMLFMLFILFVVFVNWNRFFVLCKWCLLDVVGMIGVVFC